MPLSHGTPSAEVSERVVFGHSMQTLIRLAEPLSPGLRVMIESRGVDPDSPSAGAYPFAQYMQVMSDICEARWPELPKEEAYFQMGRAFLQHYEETLLGKALLALVRIIGPRKCMQRMTRSFRTANNFTEVKVVEQGPTHFEVWFNYVERPTYYRGVLMAGIEAAAARKDTVSVDLISRRGMEATYRIRWGE